MEKLLKQRVEILAQKVEKMKSGGAGEGYTKAEADAKFLSKDDASTDYQIKIADLSEIRSGAAAGATAVQPEELEKIVDNGAKNLLSIPTLTATESGIILDHYNISPIPAGTYMFYGEATNVNFSEFVFYDNNGTEVAKFYPGATANQFTLTDTATQIKITVNVSSSSATLKAMVCTVADWEMSQNYVPFALPNPIFTPALIEQVDSGAKNIIKMFDSFTSVPEGLTVTKNSDGTITLNGNVTSAAYIHIGSISAKAGTYRMLSSSVILSENVVSFMYTHDNHMASDGERETYTYQSDWNTDIVLYCPANTTYNNVTYWPMICTLADWNVSQAYQPYRPSYQELYEMVLALQTTRTATKRKTTKTKTNEE